jgi:hypothetical protein
MMTVYDTTIVKHSPLAYSPAAMMLRGALLCYLRPRLRSEYKPGVMRMIDTVVAGVTSRRYDAYIPAILARVRRVTTGKLAPDSGIEDLPALLAVLADEIKRADRATISLVG